MNLKRAYLLLASAVILAGSVSPGWGQEPPPAEKKDGPVKLGFNLGPQDVLLPITSVEYGAPDRWSFTARYIHMFDQDRDEKAWLNNFTVALIPGTDGGRLGFGWQGIYTGPKTKVGKRSDLGLFLEARAVLLRTWDHPLETEANRTFAGVELRGAWAPLVNLGVGWYRQVSSHEGPADSFWGFHIGFGL